MKLEQWTDAPWIDEAHKLLPVLEQWKSTVAPLNRMYEMISDCFGFSGSGKFQQCFDALEKAISEMPVILCNDGYKWIEWFRWENNMGSGDLTACLDDNDHHKPVKTLLDLAVILTAPTKGKDQHQQPCPCAWCKVEEENKEMAKENP